MKREVLENLVIVCFSLFMACSAQSTYYVTPTPSTPCPGGEVPCHNLSGYVANGSFNNLPKNTTIQFLPGNHTLETTITLENLTSLTLLGDSSSLPEVTSRIICTWPAGFTFTDITDLHINALAFISCGHNDVGSLNITSVKQSHIFRCTFESNYAADNDGVGGAIAAWYSSFRLVENTFQNNSAYYSGGAISIQNGKPALTTNVLQNKFAEGYGGAIAALAGTSDIATSPLKSNSAKYTEDSTLYNTFPCNSARSCGGAIAAVGGTLNITTNIFQNNFAIRGGAIDVNYGILSLTNNTFLGNSAERYGGAIASHAGALNITTTTFQKNAAGEGGAIVAYRGGILSLTNNTFLGNSANETGGAILAGGGTLNITTNTFQNNFGQEGGALSAHDAILVLSNNTFKYNFAASYGGAISTVYVTLSLTTNTFLGNSAVRLGGAITANAGTLKISTNTFKNNSAHQGGAMEAFNRGILSLANNTFQGNSAKRFGGAIAADGPETLLNITTDTFQNNSGREGGAISAGVVILSLTNSTFMNNSAAGGTGGAIIVKVGGSLNITTSTFQGNWAEYGGAILAVSGTLSLTSNTFQNNSAYIGGALHAILSAVKLTGNTFRKNFALSSGGALAAYTSNVSLQSTTHTSNVCNAAKGACVLDHQLSRMEKASIDSNRATYGGGLYVVNTTVRGNLVLTENSAIEGGAISAYRGTFLLNGITIVANNSATIGGGLLLSEDSKLYLASDTTIRVINNTAQETGGAIQVKAVNQLELCIKEIELVAVYQYESHCFFQIELSNKQPYAPHLHNTSELRQFIKSLNISLHFENNSAKYAGVDLYGGLVDSCLLSSIRESKYYHRFSYSGIVFDVITSGKSNITSDPIGFCICKDQCSVRHYSVSVYPGGTVEVPVTALGQRNQTTIATIRVVDISNSITLKPFEYSQNISRGCSTLRYTISSHAVGTTQKMTLHANGLCSLDHPVTVTLDILYCPPGFQLPQSRSHCTCDQRLLKYTDTCVVDNETVLRLRNAEFWVGYNDDKGLILHPHCPFDYCTSEETYLKVNNSDEQCKSNRSGLLCGKCSDNLSLVLGSSRCLQCSNSYLSLLAAFALAGIALVLFLLSLKLTVAAGTINGLIFYANVVTMNSAIFFRPGTSNVLTVFIAWINLDLGIETCFYNGMDAYSKTWLQFAYPIYVWALVGVTIIGSNYSGRMARVLGRNPIAVLATLFLLSYAKLLRTAIAALSYTTLEYPNSQIAVWLYDGNIGYLSSKHIPLFIVALACLLFLFLPYTTLLTVAQWLQMKSGWRVFSWINNRYLFTFLDAYHAPYSTKRRYHIGMMLVLRLALFLVSAVNVLGDPRINLLAVLAALTVITPTILAGNGVYKSRCLSVLDLSFLVNLIILVSTTLYVYPNEANQNSVTFTSVSIAFTTFIGIAIHHSIQQIKATQLWRRLFPRHEYERVPLDDENGGEEDPPDHVYVSGCAPTQTVVDIRELRRERMHRAAEFQETQEATELQEPWDAAEPREPQNPIESQEPLKATY